MSHRRASLLALLLPFVASACASTRRPAPATQTSTPPSNAAAAERGEARIARMLTAEGTIPLAPQAVELPDGSFHATAQGTAAVSIRREENRFVVDLPIGGQGPAQCFIFAETIDVANATRIAYNAVRDHLPNTELRAIDAGFVGDSPYIDLQFLYVVQSPQGNLIGHMKLRGANVGTRGILCHHDEPGFVQTFDRATRPLLQAPAVTPPVTRYLVLLDGHATGFATNRRAEGSTVEEVDVAALLLPRSANELIALDTVSVQHATQTGELIDSTDAVSENQELSNYTLRRTGPTRRYRVEGRHLGRDIAGDLTPAAPLVHGTHGIRHAWRTLGRDGAPAQIELPTWHHGDPLAVTSTVFRLERRVDTDRLWLTMLLGQTEMRVLQGPAPVPEEIVVTLAGRPLSHRLVPR